MKLKHFLCIFAFTNYARTSGRLRLLGRVLRHAVALLVIGFLAITAFRRISLLDILERSFANSAISAHWSTLPSVNATNITVIADKKENVDAFEKAFAEFAVFQNEALRTRNFTDKNVIIAKVDNGVGIGNRMPLVAACFLWAMLTRRVFLTNYAHFYEYFEPAKELVNFNMDPYMTDLKAAIPNDDYTWHCDHGLFESLLDANLTISWRLLRIVRIECWDNPQFPLFGNPHYTAILKNWFPKSDPFHRIGTKLFRLNPKWTAMTESFHSNRLSSFSKVIGVHLRTKKLVPRRLALNVDHFVNLVAAHIEAFPRTMTNGSRINADPYLGHKPQRLRRQKRLKTVIYVAGDDEGTREYFTKKIEALGLPVVYQQGSFLASKTFGGNPGTEDSGIFDLFMLSKSSQLILPYSSSFGQMASGLGDVPVLSILHEPNDWAKRRDGARFTTSMYREPCFFHGARYLQELTPSRRAQFKALAPIWMEQSQCHYYV